MYNYTYDADGIRTSKTVGNTTYNYYTDGGQLKAMTITVGTTVTTMQFYYNALGTPVAFKYNGTLYYYLTNLQGDVIGILDTNGLCATYTYDAWGRIVDTFSMSNLSETLLNANPLRYRGYIYDTETGFYYLQSRYYDPEVGRFINADGYVSTGTGFVGYNMYAYCNNNPVSRFDNTGYSWTSFTESFIQIINKSSGVFAFAGAITQTDSPIPGVADLIGAIIAVTAVTICAGYAIVNDSSMQVDSQSLPNEKEISIIGPIIPNKQAYFTVDPYKFNPNGLIRNEYPGTKNGKIIKWVDPVTNITIFEWNEDIRFGPHYHIPVFGIHVDHIIPGSIVPEPLNSIYFGG